MHAMRMWFLLVLFGIPLHADFRAYRAIPKDPALQREVERIAEETLAEFAASKLTEGNLSISLIDMADPAQPRRAAFREWIPYHPASVVKAFYLVVANDQLARSTLKTSPELERAMHDMIVNGSNDATSYVVDAISGVSSGSQLPPRDFRVFQKKRNVANDYFHARGYDINANGKTWCENLYGREKQLLGENREFRNRLTSAAAASLMYGLVTGRFTTPARTEKMLELLKRPLTGETERDDQQVREFIGASLPAGSRLWSKAGWTGEVRHDVAYVELPNGRKYILAVFTRGASADIRPVPAVSAKVAALMGASPTSAPPSAAHASARLQTPRGCE